MSVYDLDLDALRSLLGGWDEPGYRAQQIWEGLYRSLHTSWEQFTNLPKALRARLQSELDLATIVPAATVESSDGQTRKLAFSLRDGLKVETVLMRYSHRATVCASTQVGCAMGCVFCATGQMGFRRNLTSGEIVAQVLYFGRELQAHGQRLTNVVLMGMGEPFHNYQSTMAAIDRLNDPSGFGFGERRFTVSTVGLPPMIRRFADEHRQVNLAISLHAASDELRAQMLPVNRKYPIHEVLDACRYYSSVTGRRVSFEWTLVRGVNDGIDQARQLAALLRGMLCHVNAIPLNPTQGYAGGASNQTTARLFKEALEGAGVSCTIRLRRGVEIAAGCGQLVCD
jgi:23S rRNA (adenine2503-C2)-methyltransferase